MSIELNGKTFTTWEDVENKLFTPDEITESASRVAEIIIDTEHTNESEMTSQ